MAEYILREYRREDFPRLVKLWRDIFGDPEELISAFLQVLPAFGTGAVAEREGLAVGAAYAIDGMDICDGRDGKSRCGYIYAVAVSPEHRHQGLGAALSRRAAELARLRGARLICTLPAEESLYPWYGKILGLSCALRRRAFTVQAAALLPCRAAGPEEYLAVREELLKGRPHLGLNRELMDFAGLFYRSFGGGLYLCGVGVCAAYGDKELIIRELIAPEGLAPESLAASLAAFMGGEKARYYLPSQEGEAYISAPENSLPPDFIWNLSFD